MAFIYQRVSEGTRSPLTDLLSKIDVNYESLADLIIKGAGYTTSWPKEPTPDPEVFKPVTFVSRSKDLRVLIGYMPDGYRPRYADFRNHFYTARDVQAIKVLDVCEDCERVETKKEEVTMGPCSFDPVKVVVEVEKAKKEYAELPKYDPKKYTAPRDEKKNLTGYVETVCKGCGMTSIHTLKHVTKFIRGFEPEAIVLKGGAMLDHCLLCGHDVAYRLDKEATLE